MRPVLVAVLMFGFLAWDMAKNDGRYSRTINASSMISLARSVCADERPLERGGYPVVPDDIAYWKQERAKLQQQLKELESEAVPKASLPLIQYLKTRIGDVDRHIAALETRRIA